MVAVGNVGVVVEAVDVVKVELDEDMAPPSVGGDSSLVPLYVFAFLLWVDVGDGVTELLASLSSVSLILLSFLLCRSSFRMRILSP